MNRLVPRTLDALAHLGAAAMLVVAAGAAIWLIATIVGVHVSILWIIGGLGLVVAWIMARTPPRRPAPVAAQQPARPLTKAEIEAIVILWREGAITTRQMRRALGGMIPPDLDETPTTTGRRPR